MVPDAPGVGAVRIHNHFRPGEHAEMASNTVVLLVHGMGSATPPGPGNNKLGSFGREFKDSLDKVLHEFDDHKNDSIGKYVQIEEFCYNDKFEKIRKQMSDNASDVRTRFDMVERLFPGGTFLQRFVSEFTAWEAEFSNEEFFYTHWLDVLFYCTYIGGWIRALLAQRIAELIAEHGSKKIHIVAHSLGTAVVHDTLAQIYPPGGEPIPGTPAWFSVENDQLESLWMISNVSKLVNTVSGLADPLAPGTTVKPGQGGCTKRFYNVRHELDPFAMIRKFDPRNDGKWVSFDNYKLCYRLIENDVVGDANTHSFSQYLRDPNVSFPLLRKLMGSSKFRPGKTERDAYIENHANESMTGAFSELEQAFRDIDVSELGTIRDFLTAGEKFRKVIEEIRGQQKA